MDFAKTLVERTIKKGADAAQVLHVESERFEIDADTKVVNLVRTNHGDDSTLTVFRDGKKGTANLNGRGDHAIHSAIHNALEAADAGLEDEANQIAETESQPPSRHGPVESDRQAMLEAVEAHLAHVAEHYPQLLTRHAIYAFNELQRSFVNSNGVQQQERRASYQFGTMFSAKNEAKSTSFCYSGASSYEPFPALIEVASIKRLMEESFRSLDPQPVPEKFVGDVIVTPDCMQSFIGTIAQALGGHALMAQTSPYKDRMGEAIASSPLTLLNRPRHERFPEGADFDGFGVLTEDADIIVNGILNEFLIDFYFSKKLGLPQTVGRGNFFVPGGDKPIDEIIAETERGIILSRFAGGRPNDKLDFSGVAKNSFYVEDGEVRFALIETMIAGNFQDLLMNIRDLSRESVNFGGSQYPYLAVSGVTISGK
jgi:PmbA protein